MNIDFRDHYYNEATNKTLCGLEDGFSAVFDEELVTCEKCKALLFGSSIGIDFEISEEELKEAFGDGED